MKKVLDRKHRVNPILIIVLFVLVAIWFWIYFTPMIQPRLGRGWKILTRESKRILGWEKGEISSEEKQIREKVILKKMEEASSHQDWRSLVPEYPRSKKLEPTTKEEMAKVLKNSPEFQEIDKELKEYLKKKGDFFNTEPPVPSLEDATDLSHMKDRGEEKVIENLLSPQGRTFQEKPLEENLLLGIKGPLATRKILERPNLPQVKVKVEAEMELTLYVLPNGVVDRVIPSVKVDAELERIAIQYLKQWRFVPLPKDQAQVEQWGVIPIKFRLQ
jgi:TonB family protein